ncbi:LOW QUALITY PROTEIN: uncharacterized protein [Amphiura filiformis]|uniref:LOW QUALITY PROTEIN: uncharacterized protein n=1 Tax=Amphiura filiformis TaxID=82378 RepID=UPI003B225F19
MSAKQAEKKYGNNLHPNNAAKAGNNRWFASESAVEFSTRRSTDSSWISASERGTGILPPMTDARTGKPKFISASFTAGQQEHFDTRQLRSRGRRLSLQNNKLVVSHLRRRLRQRLSDAFVDELSSSDEEGKDSEPTNENQPKTKKSDKVDIFSKYNDIGGRLSKEGQVQDGLHPEKARKSSSDHLQKNTGKQTSAHSNLELSKSKSTSAKDKAKISSNHSNAQLGSSTTEPLNVANVVISTKDQSTSGVQTLQEDDNKNRLSVSRESKQASSTGSVKSLQLDDTSSSSSLPKIEIPRSPSRGSVSSHSPLPPDFKLPPIGDAQSLVSPDYKTKKFCFENSEASKSDQISDSNSDVSKVDAKEMKDGPSTSSTDGVDDVDKGVEQEDDDKDVLLPNQEEDKEDVVNEEEVDSKGFEFDKDLSPVPTPQPATGEVEVVGMEDNLKRLREQVYQGCLDREWPIPTRIIRVYVSSTFLDFEAERTALVAKCYPKLRSLCRQRGYEFQVCDMRWGICDTMLDDHSFHKLCLQQLQSCQTMSKCVNFVSFLGHHYGRQGIPSRISVDVFEAVLSALQKERDKMVERRNRRSQPGVFISESGAGIGLGAGYRKRSITDPQRPQLGAFVAGMMSQKATSSNMNKKASDGKKRAGKMFLTKVNKMVTSFKLKDLGRKRKETQVSVTTEEDENCSETESEKMMDEKQVEKEYETNIDVLKTWYKLDENTVPPVYQLQSISSEYRDIISSDKVKTQRARNKWLVTQKRLKKIFTKYLSKAERSESDQFVVECNQSTTEKEIEEGILKTNGDLHNKALLFRRHISELKSNLQDFAARNYIDLHNLRPEIDTVLGQKVEDMRKDKVPKKLPFNNIFDLSVAWFKNGIDPAGIRQHSIYIDRLTNEFYEVMKNKIEKCLDARVGVDAANREHPCEEVAQHLNLAYERCKTFYGRTDVLTHIKQYILSDSNQPLILYGPSGCGKTSIMAKAAQLTRQWLKSDDVTIMIQCIGHTPESANIRTLTRQLCQQISEVYDLDVSSVPQDYFGVLNDFNGRLSIASDDKPLVIFLDGLDQLGPEHSPQQVHTWFPKQLPDNVHMILSTSSSSDVDILKGLKRLLGAGNNSVEVSSLTEKESVTILDNTLRNYGRTISQSQRDLIMAGVEENPLPLYIELAALEALFWQSFADGRQLFLPNQLNKLINAVFMRLETTHHEPLVRRALGYITAANNGITWTELEDLLSLDDAVMADVILHHGISVRRLPPVLWCRLKKDLEPYLNVNLVDNVQTYRWRHRLFHQVATDRYLLQRDKATSYHTAFTEYFLGKWAGVPKPFQGSEAGADRLVDEQPLMWETGDGHVIYNLHKLNELPYHLLQANQIDILKSETLFNYEFTLCKLKATSLFSVFDDLHHALTVQPNDAELRLLSDTLHLSTAGLSKDPNQLASQLIGRLHNMIEDDKPVMIGDTKKYPMISRMVSQANKSSVPTLIPSKSCLAPPGGVVNDLLAGHTNVLTAVAVNSYGNTAATASLDTTIKLWDLCNRKVIKTIQVEGSRVISICFCCKNLYLATTMASNKIIVWNIRKGNQILTVNQYIDPPIISTAGEDNQFLVAFFSGSNIMRTWQIGQECSMVKEFAIVSGRSIHKDESICVSQRCNGTKVLYAFRSDNHAYVTNSTTGQRIHELPTPGEAAAVTALSMSNDYYILACRYQYMKLSEIHNLELFDIKDGSYLRAIRGCTHDIVSELSVNKLGSHAVCFSSSVKSNTTHIAVWNLETDDHKHLGKHPQISSMGACTDLSYCISASKQDKVLRIWNLSKRVNEREKGTVATAKTSSIKSEGIMEVVPMKNNPRYVVAKSINNGPVTVWNVVKGKCAVSPVTIERGLVDSHDVVLMRNHYIVVLSDKGMSSVSDRPIQVFQTIYVYNLKTKKYVRKLTGVFIVPSPTHEYKLLDGELLLGLSESRDHLIVWDLVSGHMKYRIKNSFKELWRGLTKEEEEARMRPKRNTTARMPAWDRRSETFTAREKRRENEMEEEKKRLDDLNMEKENTIEQYMISEDEKMIVCSVFLHHLCVFKSLHKAHTHTLENQNSMLHLYNAAMTPTGSHLVNVNYDDYEKFSYITLWDLQSGYVKKRLRNEPNVCCIGLNSSATRVFFGNERNVLKVWDVHGVKSSLRKLKGYTGMELSMESKIFMMHDGARALVFANDISLWDLDSATRLAMFSPDIRVTDIHVIPDSQLIALALRDNPDCITLRLKGLGIEADPMDITEGEELFGETTGDSSDDEDDEEEDFVDGGDTHSVKMDGNNN